MWSEWQIDAIPRGRADVQQQQRYEEGAPTTLTPKPLARPPVAIALTTRPLREI